ncbi:TIGR02450 family Trp-rich protein [Thalassotalea sp. PS06]|uniref:TIGR02450 family Trp-rich protein n=1 Tax=Thalassotalea sp. PS06 TaxID=2594005 RepID=UPI0011639113|nr:TIGR02450 family Trp-rich protein [Thalassotalea sp. PS06]QDP01019.1 TIGR02450 family Trp-rich protein [Thalassotalea sp. PS06]
MSNQINPRKLLHSKWTSCHIEHKRKHFIVVEVEFDEQNKVEYCEIEAVIDGFRREIDWRQLKDSQQWRLGWK